MASCEANGFIVPFCKAVVLPPLCFLLSSSKSLQDHLFEPRLDDDDDGGDVGG